MGEQSRLLLDDAESVTQREALGVVKARAESVGAFGTSYFRGFGSLRALTYTSSMPMISALLAEHDFDDFECVFGHPGILAREAADMLAFQAVVREELEERLFRLDVGGDERRRLLCERIEAGTVRFFVTKDTIAHAKIYLLEAGRDDPAGDVARRVIVGSANLSERAFSGRQAETLVVFDDDEVAWPHYVGQYEAVRDASTSRVPVNDDLAATEKVRVERTPALVEAEERPDGTTLYVPAAQEEGKERGLSHPALVRRLEAIRPVFRRGLAGMSRPDRTDRVRLTPRIVREIVKVARARETEGTPELCLTRARARGSR